MTSYKALKETEVKPGQFCTIIGAGGGLGHLAVQYAKAMGMIPIAIDVGESKLHLCHSLGAAHTIDGTSHDIVEKINDLTGGGSHGVLVLAASPSTYKLGVDICRSLGTVVAVSLPAGEFTVPIFDVVLKRITIRGSIVGTRQDAIEAFEFVERYVSLEIIHRAER